MRRSLCAPRGALAIVAISLLAVAARRAEGQTAFTLKFQSPSLAVSQTYDAAVGIAAAQTVTIRHKGAAVSYLVTFPAGQSGNFSGRTLKSGTNALGYQIYDNMTGRNVLKDLTAAPTASEVLSGSFAASSGGGTTQAPSFTLYIPEGQAPAAGTYTDSLTLSLYAGTLSAPGTPTDTLTCTLTVTVGVSLAVSLVPAGSPFNAASTSLSLDFGILSASGIVSADLVVRSNASYSVLVTSTNGGVLATTGSTDTVPYVFHVNGAAVTLPAGTAQKVVQATVSTAAETSYPMTFSIDSLGWAAEGTYTDVLTFSATTP